MNDAYYRTSDLGLAAALHALGHTLVKLDTSNPRRIVFVYANSEQITNTADNYQSYSLALDAQTYFDSLRILKNRLYGAA